MYSRMILTTALILAFTNVFAAEATLLVDGEVFALRTNTAGGNCIITPLGGGLGTDVDCSDGGGNRAYANSVEGCLVTEGLAICASGSPGYSLYSSTQLKCDNGNKYNVSTGDDQGNCNTTGTGENRSVNCESQENNGTTNTAKADCESGCGDTSGSGCCCESGTAGCGAGVNCTGR